MAFRRAHLLCNAGATIALSLPAAACGLAVGLVVARSCRRTFPTMRAVRPAVIGLGIGVLWHYWPLSWPAPWAAVTSMAFSFVVPQLGATTPAMRVAVPWP